MCRVIVEFSYTGTAEGIIAVPVFQFLLVVTLEGLEVLTQMGLLYGGDVVSTGNCGSSPPNLSQIVASEGVKDR